MQGMSFHKTLHIPNDLRQQLETYCEQNPDKSLHAVMITALKLGLAQMPQPSAQEERADR